MCSKESAFREGNDSVRICCNRCKGQRCKPVADHTLKPESRDARIRLSFYRFTRYDELRTDTPSGLNVSETLAVPGSNSERALVTQSSPTGNVQ